MKLMNDMRLIMSTVNRQGKILFGRAEGSIPISSLSRITLTHKHILQAITWWRKQRARLVCNWWCL